MERPVRSRHWSWMDWGSGLAGRQAHPGGAEIRRSPRAAGGQETGVAAGHAEEERGPEATGEAEHEAGLGRLGQEHRRGAGRERQVEAGAQPVREVELGHREGDIGGVEAEHGSAVGVGTERMAPWRWTTPFGRPVVPELYNQKHMSSRVVAAGDSSSPAARVISPRPSSPGPGSPATTRCRSVGTSGLDARGRVGHRRADDGDLGPAVSQQGGVVVGPEVGVDGNGDRTPSLIAPKKITVTNSAESTNASSTRFSVSRPRARERVAHRFVPAATSA